MKLALALALGVAMVAGEAEASMQWRWTCKGEGFEASGGFTTDDTPDADGYYPITGVTGEANGVAITGLQPARTAIPGNDGWPVDNLVRSKPPQLSPGGVRFCARRRLLRQSVLRRAVRAAGLPRRDLRPAAQAVARAQGRFEAEPVR